MKNRSPLIFLIRLHLHDNSAWCEQHIDTVSNGSDAQGSEYQERAEYRERDIRERVTQWIERGQDQYYKSCEHHTSGHFVAPIFPVYAS